MTPKGIERENLQEADEVPKWRAFPVDIEVAEQARRRRRVAPLLGALLGLIGIASIAGLLLVSKSSESNLPESNLPESDVLGPVVANPNSQEETPDKSEGVSASRDEDSGTGDESSSSPTSTSENPESDQLSAAEDAYAQSAWGRVERLQLVLQGVLPSQEVADTIEARAGEVIGQTFVVADYDIDPNAPVPTDPPLFVPLTIQFEADGNVHPGSEPTLQQAVVQFTIFDTSRVTITADPATDADDVLLTLQQAEAIAAYWTAEGLSPDRIEIEVSESNGATDGSTSQGVPDYRQVEFIVRGLLSADDVSG